MSAILQDGPAAGIFPGGFGFRLASRKKVPGIISEIHLTK
jgi:hypothetical protein